jgi:hypothetical protein
MGGRSTESHGEGRLGVEQGVGDELGDTELSALDQLGTTDATARVAHPAARVLDGSRTRAERQCCDDRRQRLPRLPVRFA